MTEPQAGAYGNPQAIMPIVPPQPQPAIPPLQKKS